MSSISAAGSLTHGGAPEHAEDGALHQQREVERELGDLAGREPDHEVAPAPRGSASAARPVAPDRVVDDVGALPPVSASRLRRSSVA